MVTATSESATMSLKGELFHRSNTRSGGRWSTYTRNEEGKRKEDRGKRTEERGKRRNAYIQGERMEKNGESGEGRRKKEMPYTC